MGTIAHAESRINPAVCQIFMGLVMNKRKKADKGINGGDDAA